MTTIATQQIAVQPCGASPTAASAVSASATAAAPSCNRFRVSLLRVLPLLLLLLANAFTSVHGASSAINRAVQYLPSIRPGAGMLSDAEIAAESWTQLHTFYAQGARLNVDDYPLFAVSLPFLFPFNGRPHSRIYVNPNGALHFSPSLLCCDGDTFRKLKCFATSSCGLESSYTNLLAPFLADLDAGAHRDAQIAYSATKEVLKVRWMRVPFFDETESAASDAVVSFQAELFPDGGIIFRLIDVRPPPASLDGPWLAAALRYDYSRNDNVQRDPAYVESAERRLYSAQGQTWQTSRAGAYIYRDAPASDVGSGLLRSFVSNSTVTYCPVSLNWCLSPQAGSVEGGQELHFLAADLACFTPTYGHEAACRFYPCEAQSVPDAAIEPSCVVSSNASFVTVPARYDPLTRSMRCTAPSAVAFLPAGSVGPGAQRSLVQVRLFDTNFAVELVSARPLLFSYLTPEAAAAAAASLPTYGAPGPQGEDARLLQLSVYPLLCSDCAHAEAPFCARDCAGVFAGVAVVDDCGVCSGGTAAQPVFNGDIDCAGRCFSPGRPRFPSVANRSYCTCANMNVSAAVQAAFVAGQPLSEEVIGTLADAGCGGEEGTEVDRTLEPIHQYQIAVLGLAAAGFLLVLSNKRARDCCAGRARAGEDARRRRRGEGPAAEPLAGPQQQREPESLSPAPEDRGLPHDAVDAPSLRPRGSRDHSGNSRSNPYSMRPAAAAAGVAGVSASAVPAASAASTAAPPFVVMPMAGVGAALVLGQSDSSPNRRFSSDRMADARVRASSLQAAHQQGAVRFHSVAP